MKVFHSVRMDTDDRLCENPVCQHPVLSHYAGTDCCEEDGCPCLRLDDTDENIH